MKMFKNIERNDIPAGYNLFTVDENFLQDLSEQEESVISGGGKSRSRRSRPSRSDRRKARRRKARRRARLRRQRRRSRT